MIALLHIQSLNASSGQESSTQAERAHVTSMQSVEKLNLVCTRRFGAGTSEIADTIMIDSVGKTHIMPKPQGRAESYSGEGFRCKRVAVGVIPI